MTTTDHPIPGALHPNNFPRFVPLSAHEQVQVERMRALKRVEELELANQALLSERDELRRQLAEAANRPLSSQDEAAVHRMFDHAQRQQRVAMEREIALLKPLETAVEMAAPAPESPTPAAPVNGRYACPHCPKTFFGADALARHISRNHS